MQDPLRHQRAPVRCAASSSNVEHARATIRAALGQVQDATSRLAETSLSAEQTELVELASSAAEVALRAIDGSPSLGTVQAVAAQGDLAQRSTPGCVRVLLVEDSSVNRMVTADLLRLEGHTVIAVGDGEHALEALAGGTYDIVFTDLGLPGMSGTQLVSVIRAQERASGGHLPIVALSGSFALDDALCQRAGMDAFVRKPFSAEDLNSAVRRLVPRASAAADEPHAGFDLASVVQRFGGDEELVAEAIDAFLHDLPSTLGALDRALSTGDADRITASAHELKGSIAVLETGEAYAAAGRVEQAGRSAQMADARREFELLVPALERLAAELRTTREASG